MCLYVIHCVGMSVLKWTGALTVDPVVLRDVCANVLLVWGRAKRAAKRGVLAQEIRRGASIEILI